MEMVALDEMRRADPELRDALDTRRRDGASRAERDEPGEDLPASEAAAEGRRDGGERVTEYRAVWEELRTATSLAESLLREVPPEVMVGALAATDQPPAAVGTDLYALLSWLRAVAAAAEHRERRRRALAMLTGGAEPPAPAGEPSLLKQPFQIESGLLRHRRREPVEVLWRRPQRPE